MVTLRLAACAALVSILSQSAPARPPVLGLAHVALVTGDLRQARRFYGELLGFSEIPWAGPGLAIYRVNDRQRIIVRQPLAPANGDDRFVDVAWETSEMAVLQRQLASKGIETVFLMFAGVAMVGALAATQMIETRNRRLEDIAP